MAPLQTLFLAMAWLVSIPLHAESITIGAEDDAAPWSYADGRGYVNDLVRAAMAAAHWRVDYDVLPYSRCKFLATTGGIPACFSMSHTQDLDSSVLFPEQPVFIAKNVLFAKTTSSLEGCDPANWPSSVALGLVKDYEYVPLVDALRGSPKIKIDFARSEALNLRKLAAGRVDAALITIDPIHNLEFVALLAKVSPAFKQVCDFGGAPAYVGFSRKHPQGLAAWAAFNQGMAIILKNGTQARIQQEWSSRGLSIQGTKAQ